MGRIVHDLGRGRLRCGWFRQRRGGLGEDGEGRSEADRWGDLGIGEDFFNGPNCFSGEGSGLFAHSHGAIVQGVGERGAKGGGGTTPVADSIAMDLGLRGSVGEGCAIGKRGDDLVLNR